MKINSYRYVEKLWEKYLNDDEITIPEIRKLEKYVIRKRKIADRGGQWSKKQLYRAESLLRRLKKQNDMVIEKEVETNA